MNMAAKNGQPQHEGHNSTAAMPIIIPIHIVWHLLLMVAAIWLSINVLQVENFLNLGRPVQVFAAIFVLLPGIVGLIASYYLLRRNGNGRYLSMMINFGGFALSIFLLMGLWGVYESFERIVDGIMANATVALALPVAYFIYWLAGRFDEESRLHRVLEMISVGIAMLTLIALLLLSNILGGASYVISQYSRLEVWVATAALVGFGFLMWRMLHLGAYFGETPDQRAAWQGWLMLAPNIVGFLLFFAGPLLLSLYLSFTDSSVGQVPNVIFFENYAQALSLELQPASPEINAQDALSFGFRVLGEFNIFGSRYVLGAKDYLFWISLRNTLVFCLMLLPLAIIPALGMSLILNSSLPGVKIFRAVYFLPSVAAVVGTALIWRWLYDPVIGYINFAISGVVNFLNGFGISLADPEVQWLTEPSVVLFSVVLLSAWQVVGYNTVLFLAGLQGIPNVLYEAAQIDGANRWQQFRNVTFPMLAPTTFFVVITTMVTGLQVFNEPYALFPSRPIPTQATTSVYYMYLQGFNQFEFGYASSIAWVLFAIIFGFTLLQFRLSRNEAYD
jgi:ABC-type sugar transport system permease subunit